MDKLYPIIRRARRPLIVTDAAPVGATAKVEPVQASNGGGPMPPAGASAEGGGRRSECGPLSGESVAPPGKVSDAKVSRKRSAR